MVIPTITHSSIVTLPDDPSYAVGSNEWNANHTVTGLEHVQNVDTTNASNITSGNLPPAQLPIVTIRKPASSSSIPILTSDIEVGVDTRSTAVSVVLPSAAAWATANPSGFPLSIVDYYGNASVNNITPSLFSGDSFIYGGVVPRITRNFGVLTLRPDPSLPGWIVRGLN